MAEFEPTELPGLGWYFLVLAVVNGVFAYRQLRADNRRVFGIVWTFLVLLLTGTAVEFLAGGGISLPAGFRDAMDWLLGPEMYFALSVAGFVIVLYFRKFFVQPLVAWVMLMAALIFIGLSMTDSDFRNIVGKPDNLPIPMLVFSVAFFTWLALKKSVENDERTAAGGKPNEAEESEKVLVWPDLVYTEMLAMIILTAVLLVWSICLKAPLEPPASATKIPNPSKAPWYFLGLQEMLVYFDPWLAGVVLPTYIIIGLCTMPYIDINTKGNGYYTFAERPFALITFMFGFVVLWVTLIFLGTFLRGPNWNFFGFYETWDPNKTVALNNVNVSDWFWVLLLNRAKPHFEGSLWTTMLVREFPGIVMVLAYFFVPPLVLAKTVMRSLFIRMGLIRFMLMTNILLMMGFLPVKMLLRWIFNLKYIVAMNEIFFNI
jgi:hypothetical protein